MDGKRLKRLRKEKKLTQQELGKKINVTKVSISGYESGDRTPDTDNLGRLADFFDVTTDYLLGRSDHPHLTKSEEQYQDFKDVIETINRLKELGEYEKLERLKAYAEGLADALDD